MHNIKVKDGYMQEKESIMLFSTIETFGHIRGSYFGLLALVILNISQTNRSIKFTILDSWSEIIVVFVLYKIISYGTL